MKPVDLDRLNATASGKPCACGFDQWDCDCLAAAYEPLAAEVRALRARVAVLERVREAVDRIKKNHVNKHPDRDRDPCVLILMEQPDWNSLLFALDAAKDGAT